MPGGGEDWAKLKKRPPVQSRRSFLISYREFGGDGIVGTTVGAGGSVGAG
jgi:hypothetical protein